MLARSGRAKTNIFATLIYSYTTFASAEWPNTDPLFGHSAAEYINLFDQLPASKIECRDLDEARRRENNYNRWLQDIGIVPQVGFGTFRQDGTRLQ